MLVMLACQILEKKAQKYSSNKRNFCQFLTNEALHSSRLIFVLFLTFPMANFFF